MNLGISSGNSIRQNIEMTFFYQIRFRNSFLSFLEDSEVEKEGCHNWRRSFSQEDFFVIKSSEEESEKNVKQIVSFVGTHNRGQLNNLISCIFDQLPDERMASKLIFFAPLLKKCALRCVSCHSLCGRFVFAKGINRFRQPD